MYYKPLVFVDVETTGGRGRIDRITEVGLIRVEPDGTRFEYQTLIHPGRSIPAHITRLTGITNDMVDDAPYFEDIAEELYDYLDGAVFVAQNVWFDYRFIEQEFARAGIAWESEKLCTVRLSRKLNPNQCRHNLDSIIFHNGLYCESRHRAFGDVQVLEDFLQHSFETKGTRNVHAAMDRLCR